MSTGSEIVSSKVDMAPPSESRPRVQSAPVTVCSPISDGGGDLQLTKASPDPDHIPTKCSRPSNLVLPSDVEQPSGASPRDDFASDSSTTLENEVSGDESGPGHPDDGGGGSSGDSEEGRGPDSKRPSRKRSRVLRFEAGSATIDNKLRQIGHGFVPVGRSPGASPGTSPDNADGGGGAAYDSYASPRNPGQPHGSPTRRRSNSIMSPSAFHQDSDSESDLEPEEKRERETIPPTDLPPVGAKAADAFDEGSRLMWAPHPGAGADAFLAQARAVMKRRGQVLAYDTLLKYFMDAGHSMPAALEKLSAHPKPSAVESGLGRKFDYWSEDEVCQFEENYVTGGKDFSNMSHVLKTRSVSECVSFYYKWKKTIRGTDALMQHKRVLQQPLPFNPLKQLFIPMPDALHSDEDENTTEAASKSRDGSPTPSAGDRVGGHQAQVARVKPKKRGRPVVDKSEDSTKDSAKAAKKPKVSVPSQKPKVSVPAQKPKVSHKKGKGRSHKKKEPAARAESFIVESILQSRMENGQWEFKVKWQDYPLEDCTWEPLANLENNIVLKSYLFKQKKADD